MPRKKKEKTQEPLIGFKGFNSDWTCRGFQYEVGKEYKTDEVKICEKGFHACKMPLDIFNYYPLIGEDGRPNKFALVEQSGDIKEEDDKRASSNIKIKTALSVSELFKLEFELIKDSIKKSDNTQVTTGDWAHSSTTGDWAHSSTTGDWAHSSTTGYKAHSSTTGNEAHSSTTGDWAHSSTTGDWAIACSLGYQSKAKAKDGWIIIVDWRETEEGNRFIENIYSAKVGGKIKNKKVKPDTFYWFEDGKLMEKKKQ